jgi:cell division protein FtsB
MILFLILLLIAVAGVGVYAAGNTGTQDVTFWQWHWSAVPEWVPVMISAAVVVALLLVYMLYSGLLHGVRVGSMRRRVTTRESAINELRLENQRLREENARLRSEMLDRGMAAATARETMAANQDADREPVLMAPGVDRPRVVSPYRPGPTLGDRVRTFLGGREPAGY